jgi:nicotinate-nucleotide--dimethylbenzimidazole phosphoribosyltransferase
MAGPNYGSAEAARRHARRCAITSAKIAAIAAEILPLDQGAMHEARARQDQLTKPQGALGRLEDLSIWLAGVLAQPRPRLTDKVIITAAADHGVARHGVSAYPSEVTAQMVLNFLAGGAAVNVLARSAGARIVIVDAGVAGDIPTTDSRLVSRSLMRGTDDLSVGPAMPRDVAETAVLNGVQLAFEQAAAGAMAFGVGDMGIGNTTPSAAITAVFTGLAPAAVTGRGTGVGDAALAQKVERIERAIDVNRPNPGDGLDVLAKVGGLEIGFLAGVCIGAAARRRPIVVDGFIATAAAQIAVALAPEARSYLLAAHRSAEPGHEAALNHLGLVPLLDFHMRLGEGTGAALGLFMLDAAARLLDEMATFAEAQVSGSSDAVQDER